MNESGPTIGDILKAKMERGGIALEEVEKVAAANPDVAEPSVEQTAAETENGLEGIGEVREQATAQAKAFISQNKYAIASIRKVDASSEEGRLTATLDELDQARKGISLVERFIDSISHSTDEGERAVAKATSEIIFETVPVKKIRQRIDVYAKIESGNLVNAFNTKHIDELAALIEYKVSQVKGEQVSFQIAQQALQAISALEEYSAQMSKNQRDNQANSLAMNIYSDVIVDLQIKYGKANANLVPDLEAITAGTIPEKTSTEEAAAEIVSIPDLEQSGAALTETAPPAEDIETVFERSVTPEELKAISLQEYEERFKYMYALQRRDSFEDFNADALTAALRTVEEVIELKDRYDALLTSKGFTEEYINRLNWDSKYSVLTSDALLYEKLYILQETLALALNSQNEKEESSALGESVDSHQEEEGLDLERLTAQAHDAEAAFNAHNSAGLEALSRIRTLVSSAQPLSTLSENELRAASDTLSIIIDRQHDLLSDLGDTSNVGKAYIADLQYRWSNSEYSHTEIRDLLGQLGEALHEKISASGENGEFAPNQKIKAIIPPDTTFSEVEYVEIDQANPKAGKAVVKNAAGHLYLIPLATLKQWNQVPAEAAGTEETPKPALEVANEPSIPETPTDQESLAGGKEAEIGTPLVSEHFDEAVTNEFFRAFSVTKPFELTDTPVLTRIKNEPVLAKIENGVEYFTQQYPIEMRTMLTASKQLDSIEGMTRTEKAQLEAACAQFAIFMRNLATVAQDAAVDQDRRAACQKGYNGMKFAAGRIAEVYQNLEEVAPSTVKDVPLEEAPKMSKEAIALLTPHADDMDVVDIVAAIDRDNDWKASNQKEIKKGLAAIQAVVSFHEQLAKGTQDILEGSTYAEALSYLDREYSLASLNSLKLRLEAKVGLRFNEAGAVKEKTSVLAGITRWWKQLRGKREVVEPEENTNETALVEVETENAGSMQATQILDHLDSRIAALNADRTGDPKRKALRDKFLGNGMARVALVGALGAGAGALGAVMPGADALVKVLSSGINGGTAMLKARQVEVDARTKVAVARINSYAPVDKANPDEPLEDRLLRFVDGLPKDQKIEALEQFTRDLAELDSLASLRYQKIDAKLAADQQAQVLEHEAALAKIGTEKVNLKKLADMYRKSSTLTKLGVATLVGGAAIGTSVLSGGALTGMFAAIAINMASVGFVELATTNETLNGEIYHGSREYEALQKALSGLLAIPEGLSEDIEAQASEAVRIKQEELAAVYQNVKTSSELSVRDAGAKKGGLTFAALTVLSYFGGNLAHDALQRYLQQHSAPASAPVGMSQPQPQMGSGSTEQLKQQAEASTRHAAYEKLPTIANPVDVNHRGQSSHLGRSAEDSKRILEALTFGKKDAGRHDTEALADKMLNGAKQSGAFTGTPEHQAQQLMMAKMDLVDQLNRTGHFDANGDLRTDINHDSLLDSVGKDDVDKIVAHALKADDANLARAENFYEQAQQRGEFIPNSVEQVQRVAGSGVSVPTAGPGTRILSGGFSGQSSEVVTETVTTATVRPVQVNELGLPVNIGSGRNSFGEYVVRVVDGKPVEIPSYFESLKKSGNAELFNKAWDSHAGLSASLAQAHEVKDVVGANGEVTPNYQVWKAADNSQIKVPNEFMAHSDRLKQVVTSQVSGATKAETTKELHVLAQTLTASTYQPERLKTLGSEYAWLRDIPNHDRARLANVVIDASKLNVAKVTMSGPDTNIGEVAATAAGPTGTLASK